MDNIYKRAKVLNLPWPLRPGSAADMLMTIKSRLSREILLEETENPGLSTDLPVEWSFIDA